MQWLQVCFALHDHFVALGESGYVDVESKAAVCGYWVVGVLHHLASSVQQTATIWWRPASSPL